MPSPPSGSPSLLQVLGAEHDDGVWLFVGANPATAGGGGGGKPPKAKKRRKGVETGAAAAPIQGRPEHTDDVNHSGTWHVQLQVMPWLNPAFRFDKKVFPHAHRRMHTHQPRQTWHRDSTRLLHHRERRHGM